MTVADMFAKGGPVVWILLGYSVVALAIVLERTLEFVRMGRLPIDFESKLHQALRRGRAEQLLTDVQGPEARVLVGMLDAAHEGVRDLARVATRIGSDELRRMERGFRTLGFLADTAPLMGLFGTVIGMIKAFMVIEQAGGRVDAHALAGGIWEAMITTGVGLAVALPVLFLLHQLESAADRRSHSMQRCASLVLETMPHTCDSTRPDTVEHPEEIRRAI